MLQKYGLEFPDDADALRIEFHMIQHGGTFIHKGKEVGLGLFHHYRAAQQLLWSDYHDIGLTVGKCGNSLRVLLVNFILNRGQISVQLKLWIADSMFLKLAAQEEEVPN